MAALYNYLSVLSLVQDAATRLNLVKPTGVYDSPDENSIFFGSIINEIGPMLQDVYGWQQFQREFTVTGDGIITDFDLPAGLSRFVDNTGWSQTNRRPVIIVNDQQWAAARAWVSKSFFINPACKMENDQLQFLTPPALNEVITFQYVTRYWVQDGAAPTIFKERADKNSDTPQFDSVLLTMALRIKWLENRGMNTTATQQDFNERFQELTARNTLAGSLSLNGGSMTGFRFLDNYYNTPDTGIGL